MQHGVKKVLIVDDDIDTCDAFGDFLTAEGHVVCWICDPVEALAYLKAAVGIGLPDLILLDYQMPRMSGREFRQRQLADEHLARIPVILCTGTDIAEVLLDFKGVPIQILTKPVDIDALVKLVNDL